MDIEGFKQLLLDRQTELLALNQEAEAGCAVVTLDQTTVGRLSRMDAMQSQAMNQEAKRRRQAELLAITAARARIADDDYGFCEECGEQISEGRLKIDLTCQYCISCAQNRESQ